MIKAKTIEVVIIFSTSGLNYILFSKKKFTLKKAQKSSYMV